MQNRFSLTPESARRPFGVSLRTFDQGVPSPQVDTEKSRSRVIRDNPEGNHENSLTTRSCRIGNQLCFASPCPRNKARSIHKYAEQIEALHKKFDEAFNKHDAAAVAALFTLDAVQVGNLADGVIRFPVNKPSRKLTQSNSHRVPGEFVDKLFSSMRSATRCPLSRNGVKGY